MTTAFSDLLSALHSPGPDEVRASELALFGQFVGSWEIAWTGHLQDGSQLHASGELHFGWVLGGRAVQDTWIVPGPGEPDAGVPPYAFHGTTVRFFDPKLAAWRSTWIDPVNGRVRRFLGRTDGDRIVLISDEESPILRWSFSAITADRFHWSGERSDDGGTTWVLEDEMDANRMHR